MAITVRNNSKMEFIRRVQSETRAIEKAQQRPLARDVKEQRRTRIILFFGLAALIGAPTARYTIWRRAYEPTLSSQLKMSQQIDLPAALHLLTSN